MTVLRFSSNACSSEISKGKSGDRTSVMGRAGPKALGALLEEGFLSRGPAAPEHLGERRKQLRKRLELNQK